MSVAELGLTGARARGATRATVRTHRFELWFVAGALVSGVTYGMVPMLLPQFVSAQGGNAMAVGMTMGVLFTGCLFAPLWGVLAERTHLHRPLAVVSAGLAGVALSQVASSDEQWVWIAGIAVVGMCATGATVIGGLLIAERAPRDDWAKRQGAAVMTYATGTAGGLAMAAVFSGEAATYGLRFGGMVLLAAAGVALVLMPWVPRKRNLRTADAIDLEGNPVMRQAPGPGDGLARVELPRWKTPLVLFVVGFTLLHLASCLVLFQYPLLAPDVFELTPGAAAAIFGLAALVAVVWYPAVGRTARTRDPVDVLTRASWMRGVVFGELAVLATLTVGWSALGGAALFFVFRNTWPSIYAGATEGPVAVVPVQLQGLAMGVLSVMLGLASLGAGLASGIVVDAWGYEALAPVACGVAALAGLAFSMLRIWKRHLVRKATAWA